MSDADDHHAILRREWKRVAAITDAAWRAMLPPDGEEDSDLARERRELPNLGDKFGIAAYKEWAGLLLRFHDAIERISKGDEGVDLPPMKPEL